MDSVTQIALGASIGELVLGRKVGNKAALIGAICGTLPDLDTFVPYADAVATVTYHRSFSHSLIVLSAISPFVAYLAHRWQRRDNAATYRQWWLLAWLALVTHPLLDLFTVYGTQLLWPLTEHPFSGSTVFIIDPAYTVPLALGLLVALFMPRESSRRWRSNVLGLGWSCCYLLWTVVAKFHLEGVIRQQLDEQNIQWTSLLSTPAPFNSILWRFVVMADGGYYEAWLSVLDEPHPVEFRFVADQKELLAPIADHWPVRRLQWFTHGFYGVRRMDDALVMSDLRMGVEPTYTFNYRVGEFVGDVLHPVVSTQVEIPWRAAQLQSLMQRVVTPALACQEPPDTRANC